jgi:7,8-dihydropterin-6-yl-methyl-4-(beta-D-ribofuranosyl)aminobenzene 5'-phosphate synthase
VTGGGLVPDSIPEEMSLLINTEKGFVVLVAWGHAGTVNAVEYAERILGARPAYAIISGMHLFGGGRGLL